MGKTEHDFNCINFTCLSAGSAAVRAEVTQNMRSIRWISKQKALDVSGQVMTTKK